MSVTPTSVDQGIATMITKVASLATGGWTDVLLAPIMQMIFPGNATDYGGYFQQIQQQLSGIQNTLSQMNSALVVIQNGLL